MWTASEVGQQLFSGNEAHMPNRRQPHQLIGTRQKAIRADDDPFEEAPPEVPLLHVAPHRPRPALAVLPQELAFARLQLPAAVVSLVHLCEGALNPNELAARVALLLQPVRVNQARSIVIGRVENTLQKGIVGWHEGHHTRSR
jgi:hypothetical protein